MSYRKFDDPAKDVSQAPRKLYNAIPNEAIRRALQGVLNRVVWAGTGGTSSTGMLAGVGTGGTGGVKIANMLTLCINGRIGTSSTQADLEMPAGTQSKNTYVKYLVSTGFGSSGTVTAGNEATSSTAAHLPDCPKGHVAVGYVEYQSNATRAFPREHNVLTGVAAATGGTASFYDLIHMPYDEVLD